MSEGLRDRIMSEPDKNKLLTGYAGDFQEIISERECEITTCRSIIAELIEKGNKLASWSNVGFPEYRNEWVALVSRYKEIMEKEK